MNNPSCAPNVSENTSFTISHRNRCLNKTALQQPEWLPATVSVDSLTESNAVHHRHISTYASSQYCYEYKNVECMEGC